MIQFQLDSISNLNPEFWKEKKVIMGIPNNDNLMSGQLERGRIPSEDPARIIQEPSSESTDSPYKVLWHVFSLSHLKRIYKMPL